MGWCSVTMMRPGVTLNVSRGITLYEPSMLTGTTGRLNSSASLKAPGLKWPIEPSSVRRPSGNTTSDMPRSNFPSAAAIVSRMAVGEEVSTIMWPAARHAVPTSGMFDKPLRIIHLKECPK